MDGDGASRLQDLEEKDDEAMVCRVVMMGDRAEEVLALRELRMAIARRHANLTGLFGPFKGL